MTSLLRLEGQVPDSVKYKSLNPYNFHFQYLRTDSSILIDVREPFEFKGNRIKGAINIPASGNLDKAADTINKKLTLFLYCTSGFRSSNTAEKLYHKGFRKLYNLKGGITAWRKDGMPVQKGRIKKNKR
jgi:rhodanese-related sulfurtransferase